MTRPTYEPLKPESVQATREWFANNARQCIAEARLYVATGGKEGFYVNDIESYDADCQQRAKEWLAGKHDHTFTAWQHAYMIQTGECVPLLGGV